MPSAHLQIRGRGRRGWLRRRINVHCPLTILRWRRSRRTNTKGPPILLGTRRKINTHQPAAYYADEEHEDQCSPPTCDAGSKKNIRISVNCPLTILRRRRITTHCPHVILRRNANTHYPLTMLMRWMNNAHYPLSILRRNLFDAHCPCWVGWMLDDWYNQPTYNMEREREEGDNHYEEDK